MIRFDIEIDFNAAQSPPCCASDAALKRSFSNPSSSILFMLNPLVPAPMTYRARFPVASDIKNAYMVRLIDSSCAVTVPALHKLTLAIRDRLWFH